VLEFLLLIQNDVIIPRKEVQGFGVDSFLLDDSELSAFIRQKIHSLKGNVLSLIETAEILGVKQEVLLFGLAKAYSQMPVLLIQLTTGGRLPFSQAIIYGDVRLRCQGRTHARHITKVSY